MFADLLYGLAPEHLALALLLALMLLETLRVDLRFGQRAFVATMVAALAMILHAIAHDYGQVLVRGEIVVDRLALVGRAILVACAIAVAVGFGPRRPYKHWLLLASSTLGGLVILDSAGFVPLFIGIELLSLPAFALIVHDRGPTIAPEGAFKYLVLSSVASALLLFGVSLAYGATGTLAIADWAAMLPRGDATAVAAASLVLCGLFLKAAVFPFHAWAPDAYASARIDVTAWLASVVKGAVVLALARIAATVPLSGTMALLVALLALASIGFGNLAAIAQSRFRRLLAYSSVAHAGYMVFALLDTTGQRADDLAAYVAIYALTTVLACAAFAALVPDADDDALDRLDGAFGRRPGAALLLALAVLSLAGVPPFPGFFAKLMVFRSVIASGHLALAVLAFAGSFLGLAYYVSIVLRLFRRGTASENETPDAAAASKAPA